MEAKAKGKVEPLSKGKGYFNGDLSVFNRKPPVNAEEFTARTVRYFQQCVDDNRVPSKPGYALALGYNGIQSLTTSGAKWESAKDNEDSKARFQALKKATAYLEDLMIDKSVGGSSSMALAYLKCSYGYRDSTIIDKKQEANSTVTLSIGGIGGVASTSVGTMDDPSVGGKQLGAKVGT